MSLWRSPLKSFGGSSSSLIVARPAPSMMTAPLVAADKVAKSVSSVSGVVSLLSVTENVRVLTPSPKLSVPEVAT
jgi:hypothetical protein